MGGVDKFFRHMERVTYGSRRIPSDRNQRISFKLMSSESLRFSGDVYLEQTSSLSDDIYKCSSCDKHQTNFCRKRKGKRLCDDCIDKLEKPPI